MSKARQNVGKLNDWVSVRDFGAVGDGVADDTAAINAALNAVTNDGVVMVPPGTYRITGQIVLGAQNKGARLHGMGAPTLKFYSLSAITDCMLLNGFNYRQVELRNLIIDCNQTGRDGVVLSQSNYPFLYNVHINNSYRDAFVISCNGFQWVENGEFHVMIDEAGRHAVRQELAGSDGAFINECLWTSFEIRGVARVTAGGQAMRFTSTATSGASKFSNQCFIKSNLDCEYDGVTGQLPSLNLFEANSGKVENFRFMSGGFENTKAGATSGGYTWAISGTATWIGLTVDSTITNSLWGNLGAMTTIQHKFLQDFSYNLTTLDGTLLVGTNSLNPNGARIQTGNGFTFPGVQAPIANANTLDDYEEGTWTPVITNGTTNVTSYFWQRGYYVKIGKRVFIEMQVSIDVVGIASGNIKITGLPFALVSDPALGSQTEVNFLGQKFNGPTTGVWSGTVVQTAPTEIIPRFPSTYGTQIDYTELVNGGQWFLQGAYDTIS